MSNHGTPPNFVDLTARIFGRLRVVGRADDNVSSNGRRTVAWLCACECGASTRVTSRNLTRGRTRSCGCLSIENARTCNVTHGNTKGRVNSGAYSSWRDAIARCTYPTNKRFKDYGGRGIKVCAEWRHDFAAFLAHMGARPIGMTLDRIDTSKGYEPGNCRWADMKTQSRNRRYCVLTEASAADLRARRVAGDSFAQLAAEFGVSKSTAFMCCKGETWS